MNSRTRQYALSLFRSKKKYYDNSKEKYICQGNNCDRLLLGKEVRVDHIDNNNSNNPADGRNWQPLCHSCNTRNSGKSMKQLRLMERRKRKAFENGLSKTNGISAQIAINRVTEPAFREWVLTTIKQFGVVSWIDLVDGGCEFVSQKFTALSQATADRYLRKMTSIAGPLIATGTGDTRQVMLRNQSLTLESFTGPS